jgi:anti-sigma regulatory factor (Ser/Thr protein kinase)
MAFENARDTDAASLLATELVTNAVRHAGLTFHEAIGLEVGIKDQMLRVSVTDDGPGFDKPAHPVGGLGGGFGLQLLEAIADRWGVNRNGVTEVWFEIDLRRQRHLGVVSETDPSSS